VWSVKQCRLGARGVEHEDLVLAYFADRSIMPSQGTNIRKSEEQWRKARQDLPMFESAKKTQDAVLYALRLYIKNMSGEEGRSQLRALKGRIKRDVNDEDSDDLSKAILLAATDFTHHSNPQLNRTLKRLKAAKLKPRKAKAHFLALMASAVEETDDVFGAVYDDLLGNP
jgi:transposase